jgi:peroxiredoxin
MTEPKKGDDAANFVLSDQNGEEFKLSTFKGKRVLLSFHPLAWTLVCAKQMKSLERNRDSFDSLNTVAVGISVDSVPSKKAWADSLEIKNTRLLADFWPHGKVAILYKIFREEGGISERANIVIDKTQKIYFVKVYPISDLPDIQEILNTLRNMP